MEISNEKHGITNVGKSTFVRVVKPSISPVVKILCDSMIGLKGGHAIIVVSHPRAKKCSSKAVGLMNAEIERLGGPDNLIQCITNASITETKELLKKIPSISYDTPAAKLIADDIERQVESDKMRVVAFEFNNNYATAKAHSVLLKWRLLKLIRAKI